MDDEEFRRIIQRQEEIQEEIHTVSRMAYGREKVKYITLDMTRIATEETVITDEIYWKIVDSIKQRQENISKITEISKQMLKDIDADKKIIKKYVKEHKYCYRRKNNKCNEPHSRPTLNTENGI